MTRRGEITKLYHPADEDNEIIVTKKGFASMLSAKLHRQHEVEHKWNSGEWQYNTTEIGREGYCSWFCCPFLLRSHSTMS